MTIIVNLRVDRKFLQPFIFIGILLIIMKNKEHAGCVLGSRKETKDFAHKIADICYVYALICKLYELTFA